MRPGLRRLALLLVSVLSACGKPAPSTCPLPVADGGAGKPDAGSADGGGGGLEAADGGGGGAADAGLPRAGGGAGLCAGCGAPGSCGRVIRAEVTSVAGIAASIRHAGAYYLHNGSLDAPRFFAVDAAGADRGVYTLDGARNLDWEDIAVGPCPGGTCVYLADIGDSDEGRTEYVIYRVAEPFNLSPGEHAVPFEVLRFSYPDGRGHDAQALLIHPVTGLITIVARDHTDQDLALVYDFPATQPSPMATSTLVRRGQFTPPAPGDNRTPDGGPRALDPDRKITGGDVHPDGQSVLLRTRTDLFLYSMKPAQTVADALGGVPCVLPIPDGAEGGAVGWLRPHGGGYVTVGEGASADLFFTVCAGN